MSWDIFVLDLPRDAKSIEDVPKDFRPRAILKRSDVARKIAELIPGADFSDPSWGQIDGDGWSIEVNLGPDEHCDGFALHVRGGDPAAGVVAAILDHLNLRALDSQTGEFFAAGPAALESFRAWRAYRDHAVKKRGE